MAIPPRNSIRLTPENNQVALDLGLLNDLVGTWKGEGFNLVARPNFHDSANLYLQLNRTRETLTVDPIGSPIPNRGFGQDDITMYGVNYLQKISDLNNDGALHFEPGLWITQPPTNYPAENPPSATQIVSRMGSIPHGNALLAQGLAEQFTGPPVIKTPGAEYAFSKFPSFNSTPFPVPPVGPPIMSAAGSSERLTAAAAGVPPFTEYDLSIVASLANPRTPFDTNPPEPILPENIDGVLMQTVLNDPITLLQKKIQDQVSAGYSFSGIVFNISSQRSITFLTAPNTVPSAPGVVPAVPTTTVNIGDFAGGIENIQFLEGGDPVEAQGPNAATATIYATFWVERLTHQKYPSLVQLQYAQMVVLDFPIFAALHPTPPAPPRVVNFGWPHVSVATLMKTFG